MAYDKRHGGAYDRGSADAYYKRSRLPHYYKGSTYQGEAVTEDQMTADEVAAYQAGYDEQVESGLFKDYN